MSLSITKNFSNFSWAHSKMICFIFKLFEEYCICGARRKKRTKLKMISQLMLSLQTMNCLLLPNYIQVYGLSHYSSKSLRCVCFVLQNIPATDLTYTYRFYHHSFFIIVSYHQCFFSDNNEQFVEEWDSPFLSQTVKTA